MPLTVSEIRQRHHRIAGEQDPLFLQQDADSIRGVTGKREDADRPLSDQKIQRSVAESHAGKHDLCVGQVLVFRLGCVQGFPALQLHQGTA